MGVSAVPRPTPTRHDGAGEPLPRAARSRPHRRAPERERTGRGSGRIRGGQHDHGMGRPHQAIIARCERPAETRRDRRTADAERHAASGHDHQGPDDEASPCPDAALGSAGEGQAGDGEAARHEDRPYVTGCAPRPRGRRRARGHGPRKPGRTGRCRRRGCCGGSDDPPRLPRSGARRPAARVALGGPIGDLSHDLPPRCRMGLGRPRDRALLSTARMASRTPRPPRHDETTRDRDLAA